MSITKVAALGTGSLLVGVAVFQSALVFGAPWGDVVYGGRATTDDGVLSGGYRVMSAAAVVILAGSAFVVLARAAVAPAGPFTDRFLSVATWVVTGSLVLNTISNLASQSEAERWGMGSVTLAAAILCAFVARQGRQVAAIGDDRLDPP